MGESWIVSNLNAALSTWNDKLAEIWSLLTESPQTFKGGQVWGVMTGIHGALQAIGYGLLVLFFAVGVMKTCGSFVEVKKPEHALKLFIRFALAKGAVTYGLELMLPLSTFAGEPTSSVGKNFIRSYAGVCLQGVVIALSCIIFSAISSSPPAVDTGASVVTAVWTYVGELAFNLLVLVGAIKGCDRIVKEIMGL